MHNLKKFIHQNKKKIIRIALIVAFLFAILQILNYLAKIGVIDSNNSDKDRQTSESIYKQTNGTVVSDKSAVSGSQVSSSRIKSVNNTLETFIKYCNYKDIESAYNMLSDSCKQELYPNIDKFRENYYMPLFGEENRTYTIENWTGDTYIVKMTGDVLATGKSADSVTYQDYVTIENNNGEDKLNINKYIGKEEINRSQSLNNIDMTVLYRQKYMDYEIYRIQVKNNTEGTILLDQLLDTNSIYLKDSKETKHIAYSNEIVKDDLKVQKGQTNIIEIKFNNPYISGRTIKSLCFSHVALNYDVNNKAGFNEVKFSINL